MKLKFITKWINAGFSDDQDYQFQKQIKLSNLFGPTVGLTILPYVFIYWHFEAELLSLLCLPVSIFYLFIPVFNHLRWFNFVRIFFIVIGGGIIFVDSIALGRSSGAHNLFFLMLFSPILMFERRERFKIIFVFSYIIALIILVEIFYATHSQGLFPLDQSILTVIYYCILPTTIILLSLLIIYMNRNNQQSEKQLEEANSSLEKTMRMLWGEMELARKIQTGLLPEKPKLKDYELLGFLMPAKEIGGDYYDVINADGRDWLAVGDVSGQGLPAGLIMMMAQTAIQTVIRQTPDISPSRLLEIVNQVIRNNINRLGEDKYMTISILAAHENGRFLFSGLHQDILVYRKSTGKVEIIETTGMWVGLLDELGEVNTDGSFNLGPGDVLMLYTDGLTEARYGDNDIYTLKRLVEIFQENGTTTLEKIRDEILNELKSYRIDDDVTILLARRQ